ncbi:MAG: phosphoesterase [Flavobacteriales bacterium]|nr:phosphoesterase [Flavobacteriales bacterium]|tara:strand:+ start:7062 stop:8297 length:1236 start_codon:yes stop_codon:yes gene_type:complete
MKLIFLISFLLFIDIYFYLGIVSIINKLVNNKIIFKIIYWLACIIVYTGIIYLVITYNKKTPSLRFNDNIIYTSLFFVFFIAKLIGSIPLLIDDILRIFRYLFSFLISSSHSYEIGRLSFLKKSALIISGTLFSTLLIGIKWGRYNFKKNYEDIFINNWPSSLENYKIIHISDLHLGSFNSITKLEDVVSIINNEQANIVVFTGDLVNNYYHEAIPYLKTLKKIKAKDGKFSVLGNHDYCDYVGLERDSKEWKENFVNLLNLEKEAGFDVLLNESREIIVGNSRFNLVGVENWGAGNFNKDGDIDKAMKKVVPNIPTILLSHDPSHWSRVILKSPYNINLQLSGHTHGMQFGVEIPGFKWSPAKYRYKEWAGLYKKANKQIYVNRGLGHLGYAGRVGIMPDISILNIKKEI